jgi:hypothetical protein
MQSQQRVQAATNAASGRAQGGRGGAVFLPEKSPRRNWRRLMSAMRRF